eukprot:scaffold37489_cov68-Phaeocystis_antarctica.AAC.8
MPSPPVNLLASREETTEHPLSVLSSRAACWHRHFGTNRGIGGAAADQERSASNGHRVGGRLAGSARSDPDALREPEGAAQLRGAQHEGGGQVLHRRAQVVRRRRRARRRAALVHDGRQRRAGPGAGQARREHAAGARARPHPPGGDRADVRLQRDGPGQGGRGRWSNPNPNPNLIPTLIPTPSLVEGGRGRAARQGGEEALRRVRRRVEGRAQEGTLGAHEHAHGQGARRGPGVRQHEARLRARAPRARRRDQRAGGGCTGRAARGPRAHRRRAARLP